MGCMNSSIRISPTVAGLASSSAWFTSSMAVVVKIDAVRLTAMLGDRCPVFRA
jgi:hypothetical protein